MVLVSYDQYIFLQFSHKASHQLTTEWTEVLAVVPHFALQFKKKKKRFSTNKTFQTVGVFVFLTFNEMKFHVFISEFSIKAFMKHCIKTNKMTLCGFLELIRVQTL